MTPFAWRTVRWNHGVFFDHAVAQARFGASIFWMRPALLIGETVEQFIEYWQIKRGGGQRGIVDVIL